MSHARGRDSRARGAFSPWVKALTTMAILCAVTAGLVLAFGFQQPGATGAASRGNPGPVHSPAATPAATPDPSPAPVSSSPRASRAPAAPRHSDPFAAAAVSQVSGRTGTVLAAVYDVSTGQRWSLGQGKAQAEASIVKLDILETLLAKDPGTGAGLPAADQSLAQQMIEDSDNDAATSLWYAAGGPDGIGSFNATAGLRDTSPSRCVQCPGFPWPGWGLTTTTPADQITLLRQLIAPGSRLTTPQRGYVLRLMEQVTPSQRWGVSGGVPAQVTVALKNGWLPLDSAGTDWQINSIGWISGAGRDYLMAVLTTGNPSEQYGIDTIDELSAAVWENMR